MSYFSKFGTTWFMLPDGTQIIVNDITKFATFLAQYKSNPQLFLEYKVRPGERPEQISRKLYGTRDYWWTIILFNDLYRFDEQWPLTDENLDKHIALLYPEQDYADVHHYEDEMGAWADPRALMMVHKLHSIEDAIGTFNLKPITIGDHEFKLNQAKRNIRLINANLINKVASDLKEQFSA